ncbi:MAG: 1,4-alpha-glucan-branching enzyme, partial [Clostridia bacterium]|nr:1,4-alpha-glucan-branching enzyme [Clostridia bacterium]
MKENNQKRILKIDPYLIPFEKYIEERVKNYKKKKKELIGRHQRIENVANGYKYFGFHRTSCGWVYREWAPAADALYLTGDFNGWDIHACPMVKKEKGVFEVYLDGKDALKVGEKVQTIVKSVGKELRRIPLYATRVVQDPNTYLWCAELDDTLSDYPWTDGDFTPEKPLFIYEAHIGMAQEKGDVGSYSEFIDNVLPRIKRAGYNAIQLMAVMEHPYYGSFGYQVSNFFAASSRYGTSYDLKRLINTAHNMGI